jgi:hypothetical protein
MSLEKPTVVAIYGSIPKPLVVGNFSGFPGLHDGAAIKEIAPVTSAAIG